MPIWCAGGKGLAHFDDLPSGFGRAEVDRGADRDRAHRFRLIDAGEENLVVFVGIGQKLVVIELEQERNPVRIFSGACTQHAQRRGDRIASAFDCQAHDILRIEVLRVLGERCAGAVLDALVNGQDRQIARPGEAAMAEQLLEAAHHRGRAIARCYDPVDEIGTRQVQAFARNALANVLEQPVGVRAQQAHDVGHYVISFAKAVPPSRLDYRSTARSNNGGNWLR
jgi:hypothetical protein